MPDLARREDLEVLGASADATPSEVARACRELRDLYGEDSLATYSLFPPDERDALLGRIEEARARAGGRPAAAAAPLVGPPAMDPAASPGAFLRLCREAKGLSLRDVAEETKISCRHLEHIEEEKFGQLPVRVYLRGFLVAYARALRLRDPKETAELYLNKFEAESAEVA